MLMMRWLIRILVVAAIAVHATQWLGAQETPKRRILFAFFANGPIAGADVFPIPSGFQTDFTLTNSGQNTAHVTVRFFSREGTELRVATLRSGGLPTPNPEDNSFDLFALSSTNVSTIPQSELLLGWAQIDSSEPITALEIINRVLISPQLPGLVRPSLSEVALTSSLPTRAFTLAFEEDLFFGSGIAIAAPGLINPSTEGTLTLFDNSGKQIGLQKVTLGRDRQLLMLAAELFPVFNPLLVPGFVRATIVGEFTGEVIVSSLRFRKSPGSLSLGANLVSSKQ